MTPERKIIVSIAASADGFIARRDGGVDWLDRPRPKGDYGMAAFFRSIDTILWGGAHMTNRSRAAAPEDSA
jgi:dihydrofolate reductase